MDNSRNPLRVVVASRNPIKLAAAAAGFRRVLPARQVEVESVDVVSGVGEQPLSDGETRRGARQRANAAQTVRPAADFWVGLEGGVEDEAGGGTLWAFAWAAVRWPGGGGEARSATFALPAAVADLVRQGLELGAADDLVFGREGSKSTSGAVGLLTHGAIDRAALYEPAVVLALIPWLQPDYFPVDPVAG
jgi:inosine/xanthosine triphosphatase